MLISIHLSINGYAFSFFLPFFLSFFLSIFQSEVSHFLSIYPDISIYLSGFSLFLSIHLSIKAFSLFSSSIYLSIYLTLCVCVFTRMCVCMSLCAWKRCLARSNCISICGSTLVNGCIFTYRKCRDNFLLKPHIPASSYPLRIYPTHFHLFLHHLHPPTMPSLRTI